MDNNKVLDLYKKTFIYMLDNSVNLKNYDALLDNSKLYFGRSKSFNKNCSSDYICVLNDFYIDKLSDADKNIILNKNSIDNDMINIVRRTYKDVLTAAKGSNIIYGNPPSLVANNGDLALQIVTGKNVATVKEEEYIKLVQLQDKFLLELIEKVKKEVKEKMLIECSIFLDKRV